MVSGVLFGSLSLFAVFTFFLEPKDEPYWDRHLWVANAVAAPIAAIFALMLYPKTNRWFWQVLGGSVITIAGLLFLVWVYQWFR